MNSFLIRKSKFLTDFFFFEIKIVDQRYINTLIIANGSSVHQFHFM